MSILSFEKGVESRDFQIIILILIYFHHCSARQLGKCFKFPGPLRGSRGGSSWSFKASLKYGRGSLQFVSIEIQPTHKIPLKIY